MQATISRATAVRPVASAQKVQKPQAKPQVNLARAAAAAFTAVALMAAPVFAAEGDVKNVVCASNPTAKICLKGSYQK
ncbi:hypothetical protein OEZ86_002473 [Tetradesmus obliquus]|uniref:Uncharacterized protein n=2 Tax=Tetradesmus obliquus TaxID=3088 RepID=A0A383VGG3_TETOB|nr:hypothetical protein OEZ85_011614 [Tetradesmus obliquus]WIA31585.1 hypothetical protein OEZ86_002473 [Tetradesmus obliquus]|eukprot:jgi/Sobl393_1/19111/SZX64291.1